MTIVFGDVAVVVSDAAASKKFWTEKCGFDLRDDEGHWVTIAAPGSPTLIHLCEDGKGEQGNTGIGFWVDDLPKLYDAWSRNGVKFHHEPREAWGSLRTVFEDPDGNAFQLIEDKDVAPKPKPKPRQAVAKKARAASKRKPAKKAGKKRR